MNRVKSDDPPAGKKLIWLASYPKSGNTWLRIFLANLRFPEQAPVDINDLPEMTPPSSTRRLFDRVTGLAAAELDQAEIDLLRPGVFEYFAAQPDAPRMLKVHEIWRLNAQGEAIFSGASGYRVVYVVRNPLDVAVSWSHHFDESLDRAIERMADPNNALSDAKHKITRHLYQPLSTWSAHAKAWLDQTEIPVLLLRYEDMLSTPLSTFTSLARFLDLPSGREEVEQALRHSQFDRLKSFETVHGFAERPARAEAFFRRGEAGVWHEELTSDQVRCVLNSHGEMMQRLGYLDVSGALVSARSKG